MTIITHHLMRKEKKMKQKKTIKIYTSAKENIFNYYFHFEYIRISGYLHKAHLAHRQARTHKKSNSFCVSVEWRQKTVEK